MPLMMDDEMNVDHLFDDDAILMMPSRPLSRELYQRIDELRGSGCCQGIAWSKWGAIASISSNGAALELRNLRVHPDNGSWSLSEPTIPSNMTSTLDGGPLKHLAWSPTGCDLAIVDAAGRITIATIFASLNKPTMTRLGSVDPADELHSIVGSYWLNVAPFPQNKPTTLHGPAIKEGSDFRYEATQAPVLGPCHPSHSRSAFVCLTTNGLLRVIWAQNNNKWFESHNELESIVSSDDLITHAAICPDKNGTLLIAYATKSKQLLTCRALIEWNQPKLEKIPPAQLPVYPKIKTKHLAVTSWAHDPTSGSQNTSHIESSMMQLSHLEFLPPCNIANGKMTPATIMAIRSHLPVSSSHYNQDVHTTIDRWEVREKTPAIHPAFEQLSSRRNSVGVGSQPPPTVSSLKRLESVSVGKIVVTTDLMHHGKIIFIAYSDGSVEYRDRTTMEETLNDGDTNKVLHLSQIGFSYPEDDPCLQVALSPSYCSFVAIKIDGRVKWNQLDYRVGEIGSSMDDSIYAALIAALSLSSATAVMRYVNYDDLLATANKHATAQFAYDWLTELSGILKVHMDYSEETHHDVLVRNTTIQFCLSIQQSLGFKGEFNSRTFSGKFAWLVLQLRNITILISMAANLNVPGGINGGDKTSPLEDPEVIQSLTGSVRWVLDLVAWLTNTLIELPKTNPSIDLTSPNMSLPDLLAHLHLTNTVSLHFLLSSSSRGFLTAICRRLQHIDYIARRAMNIHPQTNTPNSNPSVPIPGPISPALRSAYTQIATLTANSILKIKTVETLLSSLSVLIKTAYASHNPSLSGSPGAEKARNALEIKMAFGGSFPDAFKSVIIELFRPEGLLSTVQDEMDPDKLFFADFSSLEVDEDAYSIRQRRQMKQTMDGFRKVWLGNPVKGKEEVRLGSRKKNWRRCARCASVMEEYLSPRPALQWLVMQQRRCFCSGYWDTLEFGTVIA